MATEEAATPHRPWKRRSFSKTIGSIGGASERAERGEAHLALDLRHLILSVDHLEGFSSQLQGQGDQFPCRTSCIVYVNRCDRQEQDDYRFVYIGPSGSFTGLHHDVLNRCAGRRRQGAREGVDRSAR